MGRLLSILGAGLAPVSRFLYISGMRRLLRLIPIPLVFVPFIALAIEAKFAVAWLWFLARERQIARRRKDVAEFIAAANLLRPGPKRIQQRFPLIGRRR